MNIRTALAAALGAFILSAIPVLADYDDALYRGKIVISNSGTAVSGTTVLLETNTDAFIDADMLDSSFNNAWFANSTGNSMAFMPNPADNDQWYFCYPWDLVSGSTLSYLYMGGPDMEPPIRYIPAAGGMTTPDDASMELGDTFAIEQKGYIDTSAGANKRLVYKASAFESVVDDGYVTSEILGASSTERPTGHNDVADAWSSEAAAYDGSASYVCNTDTTDAWLEFTFPESRTDELSVVVSGADNPGGYLWPTPVEMEVWYDAAWHLIAEEFDCEGAVWDTADLGGLRDISKIRIRYPSDEYADFQIGYLGEIEWTDYVAVSASVSSGSHTVKTEADGTDLELYIDGTLEDSCPLGGASVTDNANNWSFVTNGSMPYMEYHKLWVGGVLKQHIEYENAATFTDASGTGNDATPSFPTASGDPDVSAALESVETLSPASAPATGDTETGGLAGDVPPEPEGMYDELDMEHLPGAGVVNALLDAGEIPRALFWFPFVFLALIILCLVTYRFSRSLFTMSLVAGAGLLFISRIGIVPFWITVPVVLVAAAVLVKEKMSPL